MGRAIDLKEEEKVETTGSVNGSSRKKRKSLFEGVSLRVARECRYGKSFNLSKAFLIEVHRVRRRKGQEENRWWMSPGSCPHPGKEQLPVQCCHHLTCQHEQYVPTNILAWMIDARTWCGVKQVEKIGWG